MLTRLLSALLIISALALPPAPVEQLRSGALLRMHVIAQDDTPAMQAVKAPVRRAVQAVYAASPHSGSMLADARALLPLFIRAAESAAAEAGFDGPVTVTLGDADFDARSLEGMYIPAGRYPALIIRLGKARGHNWWGLLDPELSLRAAAADGEGVPVWDWSLDALLDALLGWMGGAAHAE